MSRGACEQYEEIFDERSTAKIPCDKTETNEIAEKSNCPLSGSLSNDFIRREVNLPRDNTKQKQKTPAPKEA